MKRGLLLCLCLLAALDACEGLERKKKERKPWFCHNRACPRFKVVHRWGPFAVRDYQRSTWAVTCTHGATHDEGVWRATAELMKYIKGCNKDEKELWGGTPFAHLVFMSPEHIEAWEAAARNETSLDCVHRTICVAKYLPEKYQEGGKHPPKPHSKAVRVVRAPKWTAYVANFGGFPTRMRLIFNYMRLVHFLKWHRAPFNWRVAAAFVYDPPFATERRHNEVLVPARPFHEHEGLFGEGTEDLFASEEEEEQVPKEPAVSDDAGYPER